MPRGTPDTVPDDGLTTRQRRNRALLVVHTGPGKGKSTAAFGLALRAWNQGWPVGVFQFVKSAKWRGGGERGPRVLGAPRGGGAGGGPKKGGGGGGGPPGPPPPPGGGPGGGGEGQRGPGA